MKRIPAILASIQKGWRYNLNISTYFIKAFQVSTKITAVTPGPIKARRQLEENKFLNSPSDALLSPCTEVLMGRGGKKVDQIA